MKIGAMMDAARADPVEVDKHGRGVTAVRTVEEHERFKAIEAGPMVENADIAANGGNIAASFHVERPDASEAVDIRMLNADIARSVARQAELRAIDSLLADLERSAA
ncbi:MAG: hypothetical protein J0H57_02405 [Rhodospirillales bacterium]|nr:hypothetical protein [Rhodospirillales bacterium]